MKNSHTPNLYSLSPLRTARAAAVLAAGLLTAHLAPAVVTNIWIGGTDLNWSTAANWSNSVPLVNGNDVLFALTGAGGSPGINGASNNVVDTSFTIGGLVYDHPGVNQTTYITNGVTLTISNNTSPALFAGSAYADEGGTATDYTTIFGGGTLILTNNQLFNVRQGSTTAGSHHATLDLSGLSTLNAYVSMLEIGGDGGATAYKNRPSGTLMLAQTNLIVCNGTPGLLMADSQSGAGPGNVLYLGQTNAIFADNGATVGARKSNAWLGFNTNAGVTLVNPTVLFRNTAGTGRQSIWGIGDRSTDVGSSTGSGLCTMDFTGGYVDAMVSTIYVGRGQSVTTAAGGVATGALTWTNGTINVNVLEIGYEYVTNAPATGTLNVGGAGQLTVNTSLRLGNTFPGSTLVGKGILNIGQPMAGGSVWVNGPVIEGGGTSDAITVLGGSLKVSGMLGNTNSVPASAGPLDSMTLSNATLTFDLGSTPNPTTAWWQVASLNVMEAGVAVTNNVLGIALSPGQFSLLKYGNLVGGYDTSGFVLGTLPPHVLGYLSNNIASNTVDLVITAVGTPKWNGNVAGGAWDINTTANWLPISGGVPITYLQPSVPGDPVLFDDSATGTTTVNLTTNLSPTSVTVTNSSKDYTFTGSGGLSGTTGLNKSGSHALTLSNTGTNTFTGAVVINSGTVTLSGGDNLLPTNAAVTLTGPSAGLNLNNNNQMLASLSSSGAGGGNVNLGSTATLTLNGGGGSYNGTISGGGMVVQNGGTQTLSGGNSYSGGTVVSNGTLIVANTTGSGVGSGNVFVQTNGYFQIGDGGADGSIAVGTITNNGYVALNRSDDFTLTTRITGTGGLIKGVLNNYDTVTITNANNYSGLTTIAYGTLVAAGSGALGTGLLTIGSEPNALLVLSNSITLNQPVTVQMKGSGSTKTALDNVAGTNILAGPITLMGGGTYWTIQSEAGDLILKGACSIASSLVNGGNRNLRLVGNGNGEWYGNIDSLSGETTILGVGGGTGTWTLWGTNGYTGNTSVGAGAQLNVNGALTASPNITVTGSTLSGNGLITGAVTLNSASTLCGNSVTASGQPSGARAGRLTISNTLTMDQSTTIVLGVSDSGYDQVAGLSAVTFGGILQVVQTGQLIGGEVFKLFDSASYNGAFNGDPTVPYIGPLLGWDYSTLAVDGTLRVTGRMPEVLSVSSSGLGNFQFSGQGPTNYSYTIVATTDLTLPLIDWVTVSSGTFTNGAFSFSDSQAGSYSNRFYRVVTQLQ